MRLLVTTMLALGITVPALAQDVKLPAGDVIAARRAAFDLMTVTFAAMKHAIDTKADVKPFKGGAVAIGKWSEAMPGMFPEGTDQGHDTKALPAIWTDHAGFGKAAEALVVAAAALSKAADANDQTAFAAAFQDAGKACGGCHRTFRAKE
jgi:cytochrome c556